MAIEIDFVANERDVVRGAGTIEEKLTDVQSSLDDVAVQGADSTDRLEQTFRDLSDTVSTETRNAGQAAADNLTEGADNANQAIDVVGDRASANFARTLGSFDGTATSAINGIQRTFGQLFDRLGDVAPQLAPLAAVAAFTIGYINQQVTQQTEKTKEWRKEVSSLVAEYIAAGDSAPEALENIASKLADLAAETDPAADGLARLLGIADRSEQSYERLAQAYAGNVDGINTAIAASERLKDQLEAESSQVDTTTNTGVARYQALLDQIDATDTYTQYLTDARDKIEAARQAEELWVRSGGPELERKAEFIGKVNESYDELAGSVDDFLIKESEVLDTKKYIAAMEERRERLVEYQQTLAGSTLSDSAKAYLETLGTDQASILLKAYETATEQQKTSLQGIWEEAGRDNSAAYIEETTRTLAAEKVRGPAIDFDPTGDALEYRTALEEHFRRDPVSIRTRAVNQYGEEIG